MIENPEGALAVQTFAKRLHTYREVQYLGLQSLVSLELHQSSLPSLQQAATPPQFQLLPFPPHCGLQSPDL